MTTELIQHPSAQRLQVLSCVKLSPQGALSDWEPIQTGGESQQGKSGLSRWVWRKTSQASADTAECQNSRAAAGGALSAQTQSRIQADRRRREPSQQAQSGHAENVRGSRALWRGGEGCAVWEGIFWLIPWYINGRILVNRHRIWAGVGGGGQKEEKRKVKNVPERAGAAFQSMGQRERRAAPEEERLAGDFCWKQAATRSRTAHVPRLPFAEFGPLSREVLPAEYCAPHRARRNAPSPGGCMWGQLRGATWWLYIYSINKRLVGYGPPGVRLGTQAARAVGSCFLSTGASVRPTKLHKSCVDQKSRRRFQGSRRSGSIPLLRGRELSFLKIDL